MNKNTEHYVFHKRNFLDKKYCDNYIKELNRHSWEKHIWYNPSLDTTKALSGNNEPEHIYAEELPEMHNLLSEMMPKIQSIILEYVKSFKLDWFTGWQGISVMKFLRYHPGQTMKTHWDQIHSIFDGERKGVPTLSIIGLLNDDFEGGELIMFEDKKIETKKGDILIFPSNFLYPHKIAPVTKGVRYSYVSWVW
jgi:predicted 2-oxoglutarate/Fe(II)-dependent dioxygenase YbiX